MSQSQDPISPLPADVVAQIKSSTTVTSLSGVVTELVKNSLDATSTRIDIRVDFRRGACSVTDNGTGIPEQEFGGSGGLGKLHHTSKFRVQPSNQHGHKGQFLSSLAALSLLTITSHHQSQSSQNTIIFQRSRTITRLMPSPRHYELPFPAGGTSVVVNDLFGNMPVRVKQRSTEESFGKEWDELTKKLAALLLAWPNSVSCSIELVGGNKKYSIKLPSRDIAVARLEQPASALDELPIDLSRILSILHKAGYIIPSDFDHWVDAYAATSSVTVRAAVSRRPAPTKQVQFVSFGISPLEAQNDITALYEEINQIFAASSFGGVEQGELSDAEKARRLRDRRFKIDGTTKDQLRGGGKGVDRWPMFYVRIDLHRHDTDPTDDVEAACQSDRSVQTVVEVVKAMFFQFLQGNNFRPQPKRSRRLQQHPQLDNSPRRQTRSSRIALDVGNQGPPVPNENLTTPILSEQRRSTEPQGISDSRHLAIGQEDFMNKTVKFPDFSKQKDSSLGSSFGSWTRIKSSGKNVSEDICSGLPRSDMRDISLRQLSQSAHEAPETSSYDTSFDKLILPHRPSLDDSEELNSFKLDTAPTTVTGRNDEDQDELIPWRNPVTQMTALVNARTGLVVQPEITRPSSAGSVTSLGESVRPPSAGSRRSSVRGLRRSASNSSFISSVDPGSWVGKLLTDWKNPIYHQAEPPIHSICHDHMLPPQLPDASHQFRNTLKDMRAAFEATIPAFKGRLSKKGLRNAEIVSQVDRKFILAVCPVSLTAGRAGQAIRKVLVLIDQHAADERCRVEKLFHDLCLPSSSSRKSKDRQDSMEVSSITLPKTMHFSIPRKEVALFERHKAYFRQWGIHFSLPNRRSHGDVTQLSVTALPILIAERCRQEPKLLIDLLRSEVWSRDRKIPYPDPAPPRRATSGYSHGNNNNNNNNRGGRGDVEDPARRQRHHSHEQFFWLRHIGGCPQGIIDMLNSRSCRTAIMFNDVLSNEECQSLVGRLAQCAFPFQCAHGRPTMIPLTELDCNGPSEPSLLSSMTDTEPEKSQGLFSSVSAHVDSESNSRNLAFGKAYRSWITHESSSSATVTRSQVHPQSDINK